MNRFVILVLISLLVIVGVVYSARNLFKPGGGSSNVSNFLKLRVMPSPGATLPQTSTSPVLPQSGILPATGL